jgi:monoamine oxidase
MAFSPLPEADRIAQALQDLSKIHPEAERTFEFGVSHDWAQDRHAGGIGPLFRPYELSGGYYDDLVRPVNRVWFANDACDRRHRRWIEGALRAAARNAYAIHTGTRDVMPWQD